MRSCPQSPPPKRSLLPEAPTAPVRSMYPALAMWRTAVRTPAFKDNEMYENGNKIGEMGSGN